MSSLKEVVTVVMALTMTNTLVLLVADERRGTVNLRNLPIQATAFSILLVLRSSLLPWEHETLGCGR